MSSRKVKTMKSWRNPMVKRQRRWAFRMMWQIHFNNMMWKLVEAVIDDYNENGSLEGER